MCGIIGRVNLTSGAPVDPMLLQRMCDAITHRGPDGGAIHIDNAVGFGHRRLAVIDLDPSASQPMLSLDRRYWITFNGEIYNYREIRAELSSLGHRFRTQSDTEVLLTAYAAFGPSCLNRLRGMFAFGIWDSLNRELFLARDRVGKKPLFYRVDEHGISFASEIAAFAALPDFDAAPDHTGLGQYLRFGYVPPDCSAFAGVEKLPPAHYLVFNRRSIVRTRYWQLQFGPKHQMPEDEAVEQLTDHLRSAVGERLVSDVPLGAFLSGGIDSSLIVALMSEQASDRVRTFSIGFEDQTFDELEYAKVVSKRFGTDHGEFIVRADATAVLPALVRQYGEPFADASAIPTYYLAQLARRHVTVALNGDGGDESFGGYTRYLVPSRARRYAHLPAPVRRLTAHAARLLPLSSRPSAYVNRLARWANVMQGNPAERYCQAVCALDGFVLQRLCTRDFLASIGRPPVPFEDLSARGHASDSRDGMMLVDLETYLPGDILVKVDIATMAHGLEGRSPLLDHRIMEFAARLPTDLKLRGNKTKYLLKRVAARFIPHQLIDRPKKGFSVPLARWFRDELRPMTTDVLLSTPSRTRGIFRIDRVEAMLADHTAGRYDWHVPIYTMLMLELWFRTYVDVRPSRYTVAAADLPTPVAG